MEDKNSEGRGLAGPMSESAGAAESKADPPARWSPWQRLRKRSVQAPIRTAAGPDDEKQAPRKTADTQPGSEKTKVFVSYSRRDRERVSRLVDALEAQGHIEVFRDTEDILPTEEWRTRLESLIGQADTIVFCLSPDSAASKECEWEVAVADKLSKKIAPVVIEDVGNQIPDRLAKLNYIFFTGRDDFDKALSNLVTALDTDIEWIREHTRIGELARRWDTLGRRRGDALRGPALEAAEAWLIRQPRNAPAPTRLHREFIGISRSLATRAQRAWIGGSTAGTVGALALAIFALFQREHAVDQRTRAYARQLTAHAQLMLANVSAPAEPAVRNALASLALERTGEATAALKTGVARLPPVRLAHLPLDKEDGVPKALQFSRAEDLLLAVTNKAILIWRAKDGALVVRQRAAGSISIIGFSPDGAHAALINRSGTDRPEAAQVLVVDTLAGKVTQRTYAGFLDGGATAAGLRVLVADPGGGNLRVLDPVSDKVVQEIALANPVTLARLSPQDGRVLIVDAAGQVSVRAPTDSGAPTPYQLPAGARPLAFGVHAALLAVEIAAPASPPGQSNAPAAPKVTGRAGTGDPASAAGVLRIVDIAHGKTMVELQESPFERFVNFAGGDKYFMIAGAQGINLYTVTGQRPMLTVESSRAIDFNQNAMTDVARQSPVIAMDINDDGSLLTTALKDGRVSVWHPGLQTHFGGIGGLPAFGFEAVAEFDHGDTLGAIATWGPAAALFVSPDGRYVASQSKGMKTNEVGGILSISPMMRVWDVCRREEIARFRPNGDMIIQFAPSGEVAATLTPGVDANSVRTLWLDLWRLSPSSSDADVERSSAKVPLPVATTPNAVLNPVLFPAGISASADGRRLVWITADGRLRMRKAETGAIQVIDELRPVAKRVYAQLASVWPQKMQSLDPRVREALSKTPAPVDPFTQFDTLLKGTAAIRPDAPVPVLPVVVSGNGCCAVVAVGSILRLYDLESGRLRVERDVPDMFPGQRFVGIAAGQQPLISYDGRAFATTTDTWTIFADDVTRRDREQRRIGGDVLATRQVYAFSASSKVPIGAFKTSVLSTVPVGAIVPLDLPLAVDSSGKRIAMQQIRQRKDGLPGFVRHLAILHLVSGRTVFESQPQELVLSMADRAGGATQWTVRAAFSPDDQQLVTADTKPACGLISHVSTSMLPVNVPLWPESATTFDIWNLSTGSNAAQVTFHFAPKERSRTEVEKAVTGPTSSSQATPFVTPLDRRTLALGLSGDDTVLQTALATAPTSGPASVTLVTERVRLDNVPLVDNACARLPADARGIRREDWLKDLPGEPYRATCNSSK